MTSTHAFADDDSDAGEADALFAALDQAPIGEGIDQWNAAVLRIHADERYWWVDIARGTDPAQNVILQVSRRAQPVHAVAVLRTWHPDAVSRPVLRVMCRG